MGNVTIFYPDGVQNFPRSYIRGFVLSVDCDHATFDGTTLEFWYLYPLAQVILRLSDEFKPPTSNYYTLDRVFDPDGCYIIISGIPTASVMGVSLRYIGADHSYRVHVVSQLAVDQARRVDLSQPAGYWLPRFS